MPVLAEALNGEALSQEMFRSNAEMVLLRARKIGNAKDFSERRRYEEHEVVKAA